MAEETMKQAMRNFMFAVYSGEVEIEDVDVETCAKKIKSGNDIYKFAVEAEFQRLTLVEQIATLRSENERLKDVLKIAEHALKTSYDVCDYPGMDSTQGEALLKVREAISQATQKGSE